MSVLGEEQTPDQSVPGSVCLQSVLLPSAGLWDGSTHTQPEAPQGWLQSLPGHLQADRTVCTQVGLALSARRMLEGT